MLRTTLLLTGFVFLSLTQVHAQNPIAFGPYIQNVTDESAVICWSTFKSEVSIKSGDTEQTKRLYDHHELPLTRLRAATEYDYDVLGDGSDYGKGTFKTFPSKIEPFHFVVYGDTRSDPKIHQQIVNLAMKEDPALIINTGDLVANGLEIADWEIFFDVNRELMKSVPYYPVLGNHEKNADYYYKFFNLPGHERYYEFFVGDVLFLMLDSEGSDFGKPEYVSDDEYYWSNYQREYFEEQRAWVEKMLDLHKDAGYVFAFFHKPMISLISRRADGSKHQREFWGPTFEKHGIQAVICGHDHHYHRAESESGLTMITSGGGGAGLYEIDLTSTETKVFEKVNHLIRVDIADDQATMKVIDLDGNIIDTFSIDKR